MAVFNVQINKVVTNGPYAYIVYKNGVGQKDVNNVATLNAAMDGVKADVAGLLSGETVSKIQMSVQSS